MAIAATTLYTDEFSDCNIKGVPLEVNGVRGQRFENSFVKGELLFLQRPHPEPEAWEHKSYFAAKARRFELRCQVTFKEDPGDVYFAAEFAKRPELTWTTRSVANWVVSVFQILCAAKGVSFAYSFDGAELPNGDKMRPHCAFPLIATEAVLVTPRGEVPPPITEPLPQSSLAEKLSVKLNTEDTFTFAYWNANLDFAHWQLVNMPFGWSSPFEPFIGEQPVELRAYSLLETPDESPPHADRTKRTIMRLVVEKQDMASGAVRVGPWSWFMRRRQCSTGSTSSGKVEGAGCMPWHVFRMAMGRGRARYERGDAKRSENSSKPPSSPADDEEYGPVAMVFFGVLMVPLTVVGVVLGVA